jgi:hypothetical protein
MWRSVDECMHDVAVTVLCGDEDTWNSKGCAVWSRVAVEVATSVSFSCVGCRCRVGDVYEGISDVLFSRGVEDSIFMAVSMCCATRQPTIFSRVVAGWLPLLF